MAKDVSLEEAISIISKEAVEQYEEIRRLGPCNMFDYYCVNEFANSAGFEDLGMLDLDDYYVIIGHFGGLMRHYGITQPERRRL